MEEETESGSSELTFLCRFEGCQKSFPTFDELEPHVKTHGGLKVHPCPFLGCGKLFARVDTRRRHYLTGHNSGAAMQEDESLQKHIPLTKSAQACRPCNAAKAKCSGSRPTCARCSDLRKECLWVPSQGRQAKRARISSTDPPALATASFPPDLSADIPTGNPLPVTPTGLPFAVSTFPTHEQSTSSAPATSSLTLYEDGTNNPFSQPQSSTFDLRAPGLDEPNFGLHTLFDQSFMFSHDPSPTGQGVGSSSMLDDSFLDFSLFEQDSAMPSYDLASALYLPTNQSMFWANFATSPPVAQSTPGDLGSVKQQNQRLHRPRITIAAAAMPSRYGSPQPDENESPENESVAKAVVGHPTWPMVWNPTGDDSAMALDVTTEAGAQQSVSLQFPAGFVAPPKFDEGVRIALLETLRFASLSDDEYHALYRTLSKIPLSTFDLFCALYFRYFHKILPLLHFHSFRPQTTMGQLLLVIIAIGAFYAPVSGATQIGRVLFEVARRGIAHQLTSDNRMARSLPLVQAELLWSTIRWLGSARTLEFAEVFRGVHTSILRRLHVFDESKTPVLPSGGSPSVRWATFIRYEERRRTAMACFILEGEATTLLHLPPSITWFEMKTLLPCSDAMWNAPTAEDWLTCQVSGQNQLDFPTVSKLLLSSSTFPLPEAVILTPLASRVMVTGLHLLTYEVRQLSLAGMSTVADLALSNIRRALGRLGAGPDEFTPLFGSKKAGGGESQQSALDEFSPAVASYHLAQIASHIAIEDLDIIARRSSISEASAMTDSLTTWMMFHPEEARTTTLHAGQLLRIVRDHTMQGTYESSALLYAALILYLSARALPAHNLHAISEVEPFYIDSSAANAIDASTWAALGRYPAALKGIDGPLAGQQAGVKVLRLVAQIMSRVGPAWRIGHVFSTVLEGMANAEVETSE